VPRFDHPAVGSDHDVWIENRKKRVEVTAARGSEEGVDNFSLAGEIGVGNLGRSLHPAARAAREPTPPTALEGASSPTGSPPRSLPPSSRWEE
jgi:hypothetical protein